MQAAEQRLKGMTLRDIAIRNLLLKSFFKPILHLISDAGYGEKVLFAAVDEEAADENDTSKIEDEVCRCFDAY